MIEPSDVRHPHGLTSADGSRTPHRRSDRGFDARFAVAPGPLDAVSAPIGPNFRHDNPRILGLRTSVGSIMQDRKMTNHQIVATLTRACIVACLLCTGCASSIPARGDGGEPLLFVDFEYTERCTGADGCVEVEHRFCGNVDGETCEPTGLPLIGSCTARGDSVSGREIFWEVADESAGIQVMANFTTRCDIDLYDGRTLVYRGNCGMDPSGRPGHCSITNVRIYDAGDGIPGLEGDLLCLGGTRGISAIGEGMEETPAHFRILGCSGLTI